MTNIQTARNLLSLSLFMATVFLAAVLQKSVTTEFEYPVFVPLLGTTIALVILLFPLTGFHRLAQGRNRIFLPEWSFATDAIGAAAVLLVSLSPLLSVQPPASLTIQNSALPIAALVAGGFAVKRSLNLLTTRFLYDPAAYRYSKKSSTRRLNEVLNVLSRVSTLVLMFVLILYVELPPWAACAALLLGWFVASSTARTGRSRQRLARVMLKLDPGHRTPSTRRARAQKRSPEYSEALAKLLDGDFDKAQAFLKRSTDTKESLLIQTFLAGARNDHETVVDLLSRPENLGLRHKSGRLTYNFQLALYHLGHHQEVIEVGRKYLSRDQDNPFIYLYLGLSLAIAGKRKEGLECEQKAEELSRLQPSPPPVCPMSLSFQALILAQQVDYTDFDDKRLALADSRLSEALRIVYAEKTAGRYKAIQAEPLQAMCEDILGYVFYKQGLSELAIETLMRTIRRFPDYPWPYYHLGLQYYRFGQRREWVSYRANARAIFVRLTEDDYSAVLRHRAVEMLRRLDAESRVSSQG